MSEIPTKWAVVRSEWGAQKAHLYSMNEWDVGYYQTEEEARKGAQDLILSEGAEMVALLEVKALLVRSKDITEET